MAPVAMHGALGAVQDEDTVRLGFAAATDWRLAAFEHTDDHLDPAQVRAAVATS